MTTTERNELATEIADAMDSNGMLSAPMARALGCLAEFEAACERAAAGGDYEDEDHGTLMDSATAEEIGPANAEQREASDAAGLEGHILIDEAGRVLREDERTATSRRVYVQP